MSLPVGLHYDITSEQYHSDPVGTPSLSSSIAHTLVSRSPLHAWTQHPRFGGRSKRPTQAMDLGSVVHALLLGCGKQFVAIKAPEGQPEFEDFKKKLAKDARDEARAMGKIPLLQKQIDAACEVADGIRPRLEEFGIKLDGKSEVTAIWEERTDDGAIVICRGGLDHLIEDCAIIYDLKIVRSAHPKACQSHLVGFGGDMQSAAYVSAIEKLRPALAGRVQFTFLFCEAEPPHCVTPVFRLGSMREFGERRWRRAVNRWSQCLKSNHWPAYVEEPIGVEAPPWAMASEAEIMFSSETSLSKPGGPSEALASHSYGDSNGNGYSTEDVDGVF